MKNVLYCRTIVPAKDAEDGETPTQIVVTEEANCFAVWETSEFDTVLLNHFTVREDALENGVLWVANSKEDKSCE
jgi:hypothetical protein